MLISHLPGVPLDTAWDQLPAAGRDRPAGRRGQTIAALHQLPPPPMTRDWWPADWREREFAGAGCSSPKATAGS